MNSINLHDGLSRQEAESLAKLNSQQRKELFATINEDESQQIAEQLNDYISNYKTLQNSLMSAVGSMSGEQASKAFDYINLLESMISSLEGTNKDLNNADPLQSNSTARDLVTDENGQAIFDNYELTENGGIYTISLSQSPFEETHQQIAIMLKPGDQGEIVAHNADEIVFQITDKNGNEALVKILLNGTDVDMLDVYLHGKWDFSTATTELEKIFHKGGSSHTLYEENNSNSTNPTQTPSTTPTTSTTSSTQNQDFDFDGTWNYFSPSQNDNTLAKRETYKENFNYVLDKLSSIKSYTSSSTIESTWQEIMAHLDEENLSEDDKSNLFQLLLINSYEEHPEWFDAAANFMEESIASAPLTAASKAALLILEPSYWTKGLGEDGKWDNREENIAALNIIKDLQGFSFSDDVKEAIEAEESLIAMDTTSPASAQVSTLTESEISVFTEACKALPKMEGTRDKFKAVLVNPDLSVAEKREALLKIITDLKGNKEDDASMLLVHALFSASPQTFDLLFHEGPDATSFNIEVLSRIANGDIFGLSKLQRAHYQNEANTLLSNPLPAYALDPSLPIQLDDETANKLIDYMDDMSKVKGEHKDAAKDIIEILKNENGLSNKQLIEKVQTYILSNLETKYRDDVYFWLVTGLQRNDPYTFNVVFHSEDSAAIKQDASSTIWNGNLFGWSTTAQSLQMPYVLTLLTY